MASRTKGIAMAQWCELASDTRTKPFVCLVIFKIRQVMEVHKVFWGINALVVHLVTHWLHS